jgi:methionyl aminopeptidase
MKYNIKLKTDANDLKNLRESCRRIARVIELLGKHVKVGVSTRELNDLCFAMITESENGIKDKDIPAFLNYKPFGASYPYPGSVCISVNDEVVHGIGGNYILKEGDIVGLDGGITHKGMISDHAITFAVGKISERDQELLNVTKNALKEGVKAAINGNYIQDISRAIENFILKEEVRLNRKFGIVKILSGHGVGYKVHEEPYVPNYDDGIKGPKLVKGMVLAIEPMICDGSEELFLDRDGYTFKTVDGKKSAHFEHTILITDDKPEILTVI